MAERRPFHETIVDAITGCFDADELQTLGLLIVATKIPKNHDEIVSAWRTNSIAGECANSGEVIASLLEQKGEAEIEEAEKTRADKAGFPVETH